MARTVNYDQAAAAYAANRQVHGGVFSELCRRIEGGSTATILEVGCGTGNYARALAERFKCATYGLDPSAGMLALARVQAVQIPWLLG
jgi:ubiquinone/menaquinone biosynthesis C-methylase UbiE